MSNEFEQIQSVMESLKEKERVLQEQLEKEKQEKLLIEQRMEIEKQAELEKMNLEIKEVKEHEEQLQKKVSKLEQIKKFEFSKKLIIAVGLASFVLFMFTLVIVAITKDTTPLAYLIPVVFLELSVATGFYLEKAKKENMIKIEKSSLFDERREDEYEQDSRRFG